MCAKPRTGIMLCQPLDEKNLEKIFKSAGHCIVQPKLDGERALVTLHRDEQITIINAYGDITASVPHLNLIFSYLAKNIEEGQTLTLDGELYTHGYSFEQIESIVSRTVNIHPDYSAIDFWAFDIKGGGNQLSRLSYLKESLNNWNKELPIECQGKVKVAQNIVCQNKSDVYRAYEELVNKGFEGIVIRHPLTSYHIGRPWYILKYKPKKEDLYRFVDMEEAIAEDGSPLGRTGAIICSDIEGQTFKVGSGPGLTIDALSTMWDKYNRGHYETQPCLVRVQYQNLTSANGIPRFGKFVEIVPGELR